MSDDLEIRPIDLLDAAQDADARAWIEVHAAVQRDLFGDRGSAWTLEEIQGFHRSPSGRRVSRAAWVGDRVVGALEVRMPTTDNLDLALLWLSVLPDHRRRGIGDALLRDGEAIAREHGRGTLMSETEWAEGGADVAEGFAGRHGYAVGQTMLRSVMALPADRDALARVAAVDDDYVVETFVDAMPEEWLEDRAVLQQRMSTDAPTDDLALEEEEWDADRLRETHARTLASGRRIIESAARHVPSGRLVAFTTIGVSAGTPDLGYQQDTLVLEEHRGHALGLRLKAVNALRLMDELPDVTAVRTWNAASNEHMLAVNRRLGYAVDGYSREWQKQTASDE
ncbi:GNAT family N-acetyltransferase [Terrabacter sp. 2RAF25]|uniref:GNAT family N-acetyltransferase n=1 Tax=Terrabacter sp. 2RAF25 TaxID=3232998 RepID=UPI003F96809D